MSASERLLNALASSDQSLVIRVMVAADRPLLLPRNPRLPDRNPTRRRGHLPRLVVAVADHQTVPVLVDLVGERLDVGGDLGLQRRREHLSCAVADDLVEQRPTGRVLVGRLDVLHYLEHGRTFPSRRANADPDQYLQWVSILPGRCARFRSHRRGRSTGSDHCTRPVSNL